MSFTEQIKWCPHVTIEKWSPKMVREVQEFLGYEPTSADMRRLSIEPDDGIVESEGNALVDTGKTRLALLIIQSGAQGLTNSRTVVGVGTSSTATTGGMVALQGTAYYTGLNASFPTTGVGTITTQADFGGSVAVHAWEEWCFAIATAAVVPSTSISTATTGGIMFNRKVQSLGSKASGALWTHNATVTLA